MTSSLLFNVTTFAYLVSMLLFFAFMASRTKALGTGRHLRRLFRPAGPDRRHRPALERVLRHGCRPCAALQPLRVGGLLLLDDRTDLRPARPQVQVPGHRRLCHALCPAGHGLGTARPEHRHRAAGAGPAEQLAPLPRHHLLPRLCRLCRGLRHLDHVPDQGQPRRRAGRRPASRASWACFRPSGCWTTSTTGPS